MNIVYVFSLAGWPPACLASPPSRPAAYRPAPDIYIYIYMYIYIHINIYTYMYIYIYM